MPGACRIAGQRIQQRTTGAFYGGTTGDNPLACTQCHTGTLNSFSGSVRVVYPGGTSYKPGATYRLVVQVRDPEQSRWGFELTARLASEPVNGQAGDLNNADGNARVLCDGSVATGRDTETMFTLNACAVR
ncbi:MAG: hypothetical protein QM757_39270 [Paludibaculum sp.]